MTFKLSSYDRYERDGEVIMKPLKVVDSKGKAIPKVPNISGGSEGKARFSMMAYGWTNVAGASVKLQLDSFMLTKLVEFGGGDDAWAEEAEEGYVASESQKQAQGDEWEDQGEEAQGDDGGDF